MLSQVSLLIDQVRTRFRASYGAEPRVFFAPGRVNLVGAHLDYSGGSVLPMAVDRGVYVAAGRTSDPVLRMVSLDQELEVEVPVAGVGDRAAPEHGWGGYPLGVWREFSAALAAAGRPCQGGLSVVVAGDLPMASGLSSSAAIEVAVAAALDSLFEAGLPLEELALMAHRAERNYVGLNCGIMDQFASALCRPEHALLLHCSGPSYEHVPLRSEDCEVLVMDTRKPRELAESLFNQRVEECGEAHRVLRAEVEDRPFLALYTPDEVNGVVGWSENVFHRARHVVTEMGRIRTAVAALRKGDVATLGAMLTASHRSTATDYAVSCDELDVITDAAREIPGVYGARLTGAGFGGCAIALMQPGVADQVQEHVAKVFAARFGVDPGFDRLRPGLGVREIL